MWWLRLFQNMRFAALVLLFGGFYAWRACEDHWTKGARKALVRSCAGAPACTEAVAAKFEECRASVPPKVEKIAACINERAGSAVVPVVEK